jgi:DNA-binding transcriptional ArsR family regulator
VTSTSLVEVFAALGDPNRQRLLELLAARGRASATALAALVAVTRQAVDKHLRVLERAGLVSKTREGREVLYAVRAEEFQRSAVWLTEVAVAWERRLESIRAAAETSEPRHQ